MAVSSVLLAIVSILAASATLQAASIDIYATGVDNNHTVIADSTVDPHWQVTQSADSSYPGPNAYVVRSDLFPIVSGPWMSNTSTSKWITQSTHLNKKDGIKALRGLVFSPKKR